MWWTKKATFGMEEKGYIVVKEESYVYDGRRKLRFVMEEKGFIVVKEESYVCDGMEKATYVKKKHCL